MKSNLFIKLRRGERTDLIYRDHIQKLRRRWARQLWSWIVLQFRGEIRRRIDRNTP